MVKRHFLINDEGDIACGAREWVRVATNYPEITTCLACRRTKAWSEAHDASLQPPRQKGEDDGHEYGQPREAIEERLRER